MPFFAPVKLVAQNEHTHAGFNNAYPPHYCAGGYGIAVKATYAEDKDGNPIMIFKNPKTDTGKFKKSQRGCCTVHFDGEKFSYTDGLTFAEHDADRDNYMSIVFRDGKTINECSLSDVRSLPWLGDF